MSIKMMFSAMSVETGSPTTKLVLLKLADNANDKGECWPSYDNIAEVCEISRRSAISHINKLIELGYLTKQERKGEKGNASNLYTINLCGEKSAPHSENNSLPSENSAPAPSENSAPESVSSESVKEAERAPATPYKKIQTLFNEILASDPNWSLVKALVMTEKREKAAKSLWQLVEYDIGAIERYFTWLWDNRESHSWIFGDTPKGWRANFEYVCRDTTFAGARENTLSNWESAA